MFSKTISVSRRATVRQRSSSCISPANRFRTRTRSDRISSSGASTRVRLELRRADSGVAIAVVEQERAPTAVHHAGIAGHLAVPPRRTGVEHWVGQPLEVHAVAGLGIVNPVAVTVLGP